MKNGDNVQITRLLDRCGQATQTKIDYIGEVGKITNTQEHGYKGSVDWGVKHTVCFAVGGYSQDFWPGELKVITEKYAKFLAKQSKRLEKSN